MSATQFLMLSLLPNAGCGVLVSSGQEPRAPEGEVNNPKVTAALSGAVALYLAFSIFGATEAPSSSLNAMNWVFFILALVACIGSIWKMAKGG